MCLEMIKAKKSKIKRSKNRSTVVPETFRRILEGFEKVEKLRRRTEKDPRINAYLAHI